MGLGCKQETLTLVEHLVFLLSICIRGSQKFSWKLLWFWLDLLHFVGFQPPPPPFWGCVLLYLRSLKDGCFSILDDLSCSTLNNGLILLWCLFTLLSISQNQIDIDFPLDRRRVLNTWIARLTDVWLFYSLSNLYRDIWFTWLNYYPMVIIFKFCTCTLINAQFGLHSIHLYFLTLWIFLDSNWFHLTFSK